MFDTMHIKCIQTEKVLSAYYYIHKKKNVILEPFIIFSFFNAEISGPSMALLLCMFCDLTKAKKVLNKSYIKFVFIFYFDPLLFNKLCTLKYLLR